MSCPKCEELADNLMATEAANELLTQRIEAMLSSRERLVHEKQTLINMLIETKEENSRLEDKLSEALKCIVETGKQLGEQVLRAEAAEDLCVRMQAALGPVE